MWYYPIMGIEVLIKMLIRNPDSQGVVIVRAGWLTLRYANTVSYPASFLKIIEKW